jgi:acyl-CoA synthetase (AMP-forming)/AMP-acid ligase II
MSHMSGLFSSLLQTTYGGSQVIVPVFEPAAVLHAIQRHRASSVFLVPAMLRALLAHPAAAETDLSSIKSVIYGGAPISVELLDRAMEVLPNAAFRQVYSSTELACSGTFLTPQDHAERTRLTSAGRPTANIEIRVVNRNGGPCAPGAVGEIVARGQLMSGYWHRPDETAAAMRDGWLHTGDAGFLDDSGYLHVVDRLKDMIVTGGANVYSTEVENALADHPAVAACAVIGVPDEALGERVHAVIVLVDGAATDLDDLQHHCRRSIADYKIPGTFEVVDDLPLSPIGKPLKRALRMPHWAGLDRQVH